MNAALWFAVWHNFKVLAVFVFAVGVCCAIAAGVAYTLSYEKEDKDTARAVIRKALYVVLPAAVLLLIPDADDLWQARIALVKYELAAPANVAGGAAAVERVAHELECKYLTDCTKKETTK